MKLKRSNPHIKFPQSVTFDSNNLDNQIVFEGSHNGYLKKFDKIVKRKIEIKLNENKLLGEDLIISYKNQNKRIIYHIRFHLVDGMSFNFTNSRKNIILKTKKNNMCCSKVITYL